MPEGPKPPGEYLADMPEEAKRVVQRKLAKEFPGCRLSGILTSMRSLEKIRTEVLVSKSYQTCD